MFSSGLANPQAWLKTISSPCLRGADRVRRSCFNTRQKSDSLRKNESKDINQVLFSCIAGNFAKTYINMLISGFDTDIYIFIISHIRTFSYNTLSDVRGCYSAQTFITQSNVPPIQNQSNLSSRCREGLQTEAHPCAR